MKSLMDMLINSVKLPQKQAVFTLNRIGMDITVIYLFVLLALSSIPTLIRQLGDNELLSPFFFIIFFFIFHYLIVVLVFFAFLSIIAWIGTLLAKKMGRKLRYSILWKMSASASTIPLLLFAIIASFYPVNYLFLGLSVIFILYILVKIILIYPALKHR